MLTRPFGSTHSFYLLNEYGCVSPYQGSLSSLESSGMSHLVFLNAEHLTQQKQEASPKLPNKNGFRPMLTFGLSKGMVWETASCHRPKLYQ